MKNNFLISYQLRGRTIRTVIPICCITDYIYSKSNDFLSFFAKSSILICIIRISWGIVCDCSYRQIICCLFINTLYLNVNSFICIFF